MPHDITQWLNDLDEWIMLTNHNLEPWFINTSALKSLKLKDISEWANCEIIIRALNEARIQERAYFTIEDSNGRKFFVYKEKNPKTGFKFVIAQMQNEC